MHGSVFDVWESHYIFESPRACNKLWLCLLSSTTIGASLHIALEYVRAEGYEDV